MHTCCETALAPVIRLKHLQTLKYATLSLIKELQVLLVSCNHTQIEKLLWWQLQTFFCLSYTHNVFWRNYHQSFSLNPLPPRSAVWWMALTRLMRSSITAGGERWLFLCCVCFIWRIVMKVCAQCASPYPLAFWSVRSVSWQITAFPNALYNYATISYFHAVTEE